MGALVTAYEIGREDAKKKYRVAKDLTVNPRSAIGSMSKDMGLRELPLIAIHPDLSASVWNAHPADASLLTKWTQPGRPAAAFSGRTPESVVAHEIGHLVNMQDAHPLLHDWIQKISRGGTGAGAIVLPYINVVRAAAGLRPSWTPAIGQAALAMPMLIDEARASYRAMKYLRDKYGPNDYLHRGWPLLSGFGSYLAVAGAPAAATLLQKGIMRLVR